MTRNDILDLFQNCYFDGELSDNNFEDAILNYLPENFKYDYHYGVSKLVLLPKDANFVIKVPFNGEMTCDETEEGYEDYFFDENENACDDKTYYWDYCAAEVLAYRQAKSNHVERAFCKTAYVGSVNGHPIYIQQKATMYYAVHDEDFRYPQERSSKAKKSSEDIDGWGTWWQPVWQTDAFEYYGEKQYKKLMQFIYDYGIDDLHRENIGYIGRKPVLFDYSSWRS